MKTNMRKAREAAGFSQKVVAIDMEVSAPTVSDWESGKINPSSKNLKQLSCLYGVTTDYLLGTHGMLGAYIKQRRGNESIELFSKKCGISAHLLELIEKGYASSTSRQGSNAAQRTCIGSDDLRTLAHHLNVDFHYLACLYDGYNPHRIRGINIPDDDLTKNLPAPSELDLQLFSATTTKKAPSDPDEARLIGLYGGLNKQGQEKLLDYAADLTASGLYANCKDGRQRMAAFKGDANPVQVPDDIDRMDTPKHSDHDPTER